MATTTRVGVILVHFADDYVAGAEHREDAQRFLVELGERPAIFGLSMVEARCTLGIWCSSAGYWRAVRRQRAR